MDGPYRLINELIAHAGPVRSFTQISSYPVQIASGCQADSPNVRKWTIAGLEITEIGSAISHNHWVTALTSLPGGVLSLFPTAVVITGCYDSIIRVYDASSEVLLLSLSGHSKGIISFSWTNDHKLVSGSWDGTARIWDLQHGGTCQHILASHENGVHVLGLSSGMIITTSTGEAIDGKPSNFKIRMWDASSGRMIHDPICDHMGPIRSICAVPTLGGYATSSNDGTVMVRSADGAVVASLYHPLQDDGMAPFVLDCAVLSSSSNLDMVSCGEDGSVIIWRDMNILQSIPHPSCVWTILPLSSPSSSPSSSMVSSSDDDHMMIYDGDFITASNDGIIRYFSRNPLLTALSSSQQLSSQFIEQVHMMHMKRHKGPSDEDLAKASKWADRNQHIGKSEGQVMLFNKDDTMIAAQWSTHSQVWIEVGAVSYDHNQDKDDHHNMIDDVSYDHVLPVEVETSTGLRTLQLGYNNGENMFVAAQRFIDANMLNQSYLAQIADWISSRITQTNKPTFDMTSSSSSSSSMISSSSSKISSYPHMMKSYMIYDDVPTGFASKALIKLQEFNTSSSSMISSSDMMMIESLLKVLSQTSYYHSSSISSHMIQPLSSMIISWQDVNRLFPVYDILRLVAIHPDGAKTLSSSMISSSSSSLMLHVMISSAVMNMNLSSDMISSSMLLTSIRFIVNCYRHDVLRSSLLNLSSSSSMIHDIIVAMHHHIGNKSKAVRLGIAHMMLNYAIAASPSSMMLLSSSIASYRAVVMEMMMMEKESYDVAYALVLAIGNITYTASSASSSMIAWKDDDRSMVKVVEEVAGRFPATDLVTVAKDIIKML